LNKSARIAIKILRTIRAKYITQLQLAGMLNVSPQQISKIVKGQENLTILTLTKLENALNISLIEIPITN
jgi:transcriptional regulator with XRE-family HTH domain